MIHLNERRNKQRDMAVLRLVKPKSMVDRRRTRYNIQLKCLVWLPAALHYYNLDLSGL